MANPESPIPEVSVPDLAIRHPTLPAVVAERLRQLIIDGTLKPGTWLNERDLCDQLKISRTPLREAYRMLASDGLVALQPKRGAMVIELSADDIENIFDVLSVLEGLAVRSAAERASEAELAEIARLHAQMLENYEKRDIRAYFAASMGTHIAINRAAHNPALTQSYDRLNLQVQALRYKSNFDLDEWTTAVADHEAFVQALMARDGKRAETLIRKHVGGKKAYNLRGRPGAAVKS
ncbi:GntR family transcriptional regulator [Achromobacter marplatensis]|uniref:GntR family transcriptional regulator n=1 Tax=Achromobacter marplatensis TaxID=470868 RepID=A0ABX9GBP8_9BURK|nr:GntR family transcriptional regulator [Achromobacter marplatensis]OWT66016.1 GntR family transcriptional regulator [Achromobacter marplatensis]RBP18605.1 GntR family transcriptional regulator [Achromobacter marplatensis]CAB3664367.1 putative D-xylose utilization operon transcriptional repressor [Achromobacter marplatensis]